MEQEKEQEKEIMKLELELESAEQIEIIRQIMEIKGIKLAAMSMDKRPPIRR